MAKNKTTEKITIDQLNTEAERIMEKITKNSFPQMRLKNNGVHRDLSEEELRISSQLIYNR